MITSLNLKEKPFFLTDDDIRWVEETFDTMNTKKKVGQLFCPMGVFFDETEARVMIDEIGINGIMFRPMEMKEMRHINSFFQENSEIPLLIPANFEMGGSGIVNEERKALAKQKREIKISNLSELLSELFSGAQKEQDAIKLEKKLDNIFEGYKRRYKKLFTISHDSTKKEVNYTLKEKALATEKKYDGIFILTTSRMKLSI